MTAIYCRGMEATLCYAIHGQKCIRSYWLYKEKSQHKAKVTAADFDVLKAQFGFDVRTIVDMIINWDYTGINYVPISNWTLAKEGSKRVEIAGADDKRQVTAVFAAIKSGRFLPPQIIICWQDEETSSLCEISKPLACDTYWKLLGK